MSEAIYIPEGVSKEEKYLNLLPQIEALITGEEDIVANMANISAALKEVFNFFWVGFYIVRGKELVLGPFQGPIACTRIGWGKGVCGTVWKEGKTLLVPDVNAFPGHIACNSASQSEIVLPAHKDGQLVLVLDIDSNLLNDFDSTDQHYLEELMRLVEKHLLI